MSLDERPTVTPLDSFLDALDAAPVVDRELARAGLADLVDRVGDAVVHLLDMVERGAPLAVALSHPALADVLALCGIASPDAAPVSAPAPEVPVHISPRPSARCDLCGAARSDGDHAHVADVDDRRLCCVCDACRILFDDQRHGRFRTVPSDGPRHVLTGPEPGWWRALDVPVGLVFLLRTGDRLMAAYPGPAGVIEADVPIEDVPDELWPARDVEALLAVADGGRLDGWIVPVTTAYALAGRLRDDHVMGDPLAAVRVLVDDLLA